MFSSDPLLPRPLHKWELPACEALSRTPVPCSASSQARIHADFSLPPPPTETLLNLFINQVKWIHVPFCKLSTHNWHRLIESGHSGPQQRVHNSHFLHNLCKSCWDLRKYRCKSYLCKISKKKILAYIFHFDANERWCFLLRISNYFKNSKN